MGSSQANLMVAVLPYSNITVNDFKSSFRKTLLYIMKYSFLDRLSVERNRFTKYYAKGFEDAVETVASRTCNSANHILAILKRI